MVNILYNFCWYHNPNSIKTFKKIKVVKMFKLNKFLFAVMALLVISFPAKAPAQKIQQDEKLDKLISRAIEVSPRLNLINSKRKSAESVIPQVSNLSDPLLVLGLNNLPVNSFSFTQEPMTGKVASLSQAIPFPGKLETAGKFKAKDVEIISEEYRDATNELIKNVKQLYFELSFVRKAIDITYKNRELLKSIEKVVQTKYAVSRASQQNLVKVALEITRINDKLEELKGEERAKLAELNALLLYDSDSPIETSELEGVDYSNISVDSLVKLSVENRPFLKQIKLAEEKFKVKEKLAEFDYYPNFNIRLQYSQRDELAKTNTNLNDFVSFFVGINLPLNYGGKVDAKVEEAKYNQEVFKNKFETSIQLLRKAFGSITSKLKELSEREKLFEEGLIPQAEQSLKAALASYQVGDVDFLNVIDSQNRLYQIEIMLYKIRSNYQKTVANLEFLSGMKF